MSKIDSTIFIYPITLEKIITIHHEIVIDNNQETINKINTFKNTNIITGDITTYVVDLRSSRRESMGK